jgi:translation initiation factor 3 subunit I
VFLASVSRDRTCVLWDPSNFSEPVSKFTSTHSLNTVAMSPIPNKNHIAMAGGVASRETATTTDAGFEVSIYNMIFEHDIAYIKGHFGPVNSIDFHPNGRSIASGSEDGTIRIHEFDSEYFTNEFE